jgi:hypothetical protein
MIVGVLKSESEHPEEEFASTGRRPHQMTAKVFFNAKDRRAQRNNECQDEKVQRSATLLCVLGFPLFCECWVRDETDRVT